MLMVIFGAGASYDFDPSRPAAVAPSGPNRPQEWRPPLANELFDSRHHFAKALSHFPECAPIVPFLRGQTDIEQRLEKLQDEATGSPPYPERHRQLAAVRAYLQFLIGSDTDWRNGARGITNQLTLLDLILRWGNDETLLVTFNYDRLLEFAITDRTGQAFTEIGDYITAGPFRLVKLHGSVNWGRVAKTMLPIGSAWEMVKELIAQAASIETTDEYLISNERPLCIDKGKPLLPAIAIPIRAKQHFECPDAHLEFLRQRLPEVKRLLIVGWRAMDQHFVELLKDGLQDRARVQIVCNGMEDSTNVAESLKQAGVRASRWEPLDHGFSRYVVERAGDNFFRQVG